LEYAKELFVENPVGDELFPPSGGDGLFALVVMG
jgi:hypothetical protein